MSKKQEKHPRSQILHTAKKIFGRIGYRDASIEQVLKTAGVSKRVFQQYFQSKEGLLIETQRVVFKELHRRFTRQALGEEQGLSTALDALDAMWQTARDLRDIAPFMLETLNLGNKHASLQPQLEQFYRESTSLLEDGIRKVFSKELGVLIIPPEQMAILIRILLSGLVVELAQVQSTKQLEELDQVYSNIRSLFQRFVVQKEDIKWSEDTDTVPLPW
jgi:AcrR family transcriptional regulator